MPQTTSPRAFYPDLDKLLAVRALASGRSPRERRDLALLRGENGSGRTHIGTLARGLEYAASRPYLAGDDARSIDWRLTARRGRVHTKVFEAEGGRPLWIVIDRGATMEFGSRTAFKCAVAARAAAWLAWSAAIAGERLTASLAGQARTLRISARPGESGVLPIIQALCDGGACKAEGATSGQGVPGALAEFEAACPGGGDIFVISDFYALDDDASGDLAGRLRRITGRNAVTLAHVVDGLEIEPPSPSVYPVAGVDGEREVTWIDLRDPANRARWRELFAERARRIEALRRSIGARLVTLRTDADPVPALRQVWRSR